MEPPNSAEKRREENIRRNLEFQTQIGIQPNRKITKISENFIQQEIVNPEVLAGDVTRRSNRLEKQVVEKQQKTNNISGNYRPIVCKRCLAICRTTRTFTSELALKLHQRKNNCASVVAECSKQNNKDLNSLEVYHHSVIIC